MIVSKPITIEENKTTIVNLVHWLLNRDFVEKNAKAQLPEIIRMHNEFRKIICKIARTCIEIRDEKLKDSKAFDSTIYIVNILVPEGLEEDIQIQYSHASFKGIRYIDIPKRYLWRTYSEIENEEKSGKH